MESFIFMCLCAVGVRQCAAAIGTLCRDDGKRRPCRSCARTIWVPLLAARQQREARATVLWRAAALGRPPGELRGRKEAPRSERLLRLLGASIAAFFSDGRRPAPLARPRCGFFGAGGDSG